MSIQELEIIGIILGAFTLWRKIRFLLDVFIGLIISKRRVSDMSAAIIIAYLIENAKSLQRNGLKFDTLVNNVKSLGRPYRVFFESAIEGNKTFWYKRRLLWFRRFQSEINNHNPDYWFSFIRGSYNWDKLLLKVAAWEDIKKSDVVTQRFYIRHHGRDISNPPSLSKMSEVTLDRVSLPGWRLIGFNYEDLGDPPMLRIDQMSLNKELKAAAARVSNWVKDRAWYEESSIPWRLGILLHGNPGSGKTAFTRCLSFQHNLPIHVFDLVTQNNNSFLDDWKIMLSDAPCIALIEDIDCVFNKRAPIGDRILLTFDCLINCIGGIQRADGVLLIITTNNISSIDPALTRGGRLDLSVHVTGLDHAGRIKMAKRILNDPKEAENIANDPELIKLSPADLQEYLCKLALIRRFGHGDFEDDLK